MMDVEVSELINQITRQRRLDKDFVIEALNDAIIASLRKDRGQEYPVEVEIDLRKGTLKITVEKKVVESVENHDTEVSLESAKNIDNDAKIGDIVNIPVSIDYFGRGTVYRVQNLFLQRIREAERQHIYKDFQNRIGDIVSGTVQKIDKTGVYIGLGRAEALLPPEEQIPGEKYRQGGNIKAIILRVEETRRKSSQIILSRTHPDFLRKLVEFEIPEAAEGTIEPRAVARIPGKRAKIAVRSKDPKIDPVGACIGIRGTRIQPVVRELCGERIDVIQWSPDIIQFAENALSPTKPTLIYEEKDSIIAVVPDEVIAEAKGKDAQNVILASKLVGKEIIILGESEHKGPRDAILVDKIPVADSVKKGLKKRGIFFFREIPALAELMEIEGIDEKTAYKILEIVEEGLRNKG